MTFLFIDFETTSPDVDLGNCGTYNYVYADKFQVVSTSYFRLNHPNDLPSKTDELDNLETSIQFCLGLPSPEVFAGVTKIICHNAMFEATILRRFGYEFEFIDTMAMCSIAGIPLALGKAALALGFTFEKTSNAAQVKKMLRQKGVKDLDEVDIVNLKEYNARDVLLTIKLFQALRPLYNVFEHQVYSDTLQKNMRGIRIDDKLLKECLRMVDEIEGLVTEEKVLALSEQVIHSVDQVKKLAFVLDVPNVQQDTLNKLLEDENLDPAKRALIEFRLYSSNSLLAKYHKLRNTSHPVIKGGKTLFLTDLVQYYKAITGRFSGKGFQVQNLPRPTVKFATLTLEGCMSMPEGDPFCHLRKDPKEVLPLLKNNLRFLVLPLKDAHKIYSVDYSQIEARILAWIADQDDLLLQFTNNEKIYENMAAKIFRKDSSDVTPVERQYGKTTILGCGYGMGYTTFELSNDLSKVLKREGRDTDLVWKGEMHYALGGKDYDLRDFKYKFIGLRKKIKVYKNKPNFLDYKNREIPEERDIQMTEELLTDFEALSHFTTEIVYFISELDPSVISSKRIIDGYRASTPKITRLRNDLNEVLRTLATDEIGTHYFCGNCLFERTPSYIPNEVSLRVRLPSKRIIHYPAFYREDNQLFIKARGESGNMQKFRLWGGTMTENICQALCRDLLCNGLLALKKQNIDVMFTVHDEYVISAPEGKKEEIEKIILGSIPAWGRDIPVKVETNVSDTFC